MKAILSLVFMVLFGWTTITHARPLDKAEREELSHIVSYLHYVDTIGDGPTPEFDFVSDTSFPDGIVVEIPAYIVSRYTNTEIKVDEENQRFIMPKQSLIRTGQALFGFKYDQDIDDYLEKDNKGNVYISYRGTRYAEKTQPISEEDIPWFTCVRAEENYHGYVRAIFVLPVDHDLATEDIYYGEFFRNENLSFRILKFKPLVSMAFF